MNKNAQKKTKRKNKAKKLCYDPVPKGTFL